MQWFDGDTLRLLANEHWSEDDGDLFSIPNEGWSGDDRGVPSILRPTACANQGQTPATEFQLWVDQLSTAMAAWNSCLLSMNTIFLCILSQLLQLFSLYTLLYSSHHEWWTQKNPNEMGGVRSEPCALIELWIMYSDISQNEEEKREILLRRNSNPTYAFLSLSGRCWSILIWLSLKFTWFVYQRYSKIRTLHFHCYSQFWGVVVDAIDNRPCFSVPVIFVKVIKKRGR